MSEELKRSWPETMSWDELADVCARMTAMRKPIREERGIQPPRARCPACGTDSRSDISGVSIRSALFASRSIDVITGDEFKKLDQSWTEHRKKNGLTALGRRAETGW